MAWRVTWTTSALEDLDEIAHYIARDSHFYAASFVREIRDATLSLKQYAERGHVVPEYHSPNIRELFVKRHRIIYHVSEKIVAILAIIHGARKL
ncbi:MAG: type II toxin-antitoxin system RelE/ParE family toxin [Deltaproteobacteria bacterium]|nr:type II toxin-antitoxin system RelE/ParE family toxin [Deltaproteobacteria bacterium]